MSAVVRCASAASTSSCIPLTISATRSASARAACSPSSASRSFRRRIRSVRSRMNADSITSSPTRRRWMVSSAGKMVPSLRLSSTSTCITLSGSGASSSSFAARRGPRRPSSGKIMPRSGLPIASAADQPNSRSAAVFQAVTSPVRPSIATNASGAVSSSSRMRDSLWRSSRVRASVRRRLAPDPGEQAGHQEPGHGGRADRERPAQQRAVLDDEHHRVAHADEGELRERRPHREEVEGEERGPRVEQRVEQRHAPRRGWRARRSPCPPPPPRGGATRAAARQYR